MTTKDGLRNEKKGVGSKLQGYRHKLFKHVIDLDFPAYEENAWVENLRKDQIFYDDVHIDFKLPN